MMITAFAQERVIVRQVTHKMSKGEQPGYGVNVPQAEFETVKKNWKKFLENDTRADAIEEGYEIVLKDAVKETLSPDTVNIYSMLLVNKGYIQLYAFFEIDEMFFKYSGDPGDIRSEKIHKRIETDLRNFAVKQYKLAVEDELKIEENKLKQLESELKDIQKDTESHMKDIAGAEEKIKKHEGEIILLEAEKEEYREQLEEKRLERTKIRDKEELKTMKSIVKSIEKSKKKVEKNIEKERKKIISEEADIASYEAAIRANNMLEEEKLNEIKQQQKAIDRIEDKLYNIK